MTAADDLALADALEVEAEDQCGDLTPRQLRAAAATIRRLLDERAAIAAAVEAAGGADRVRGLADYYADPSVGNDAEVTLILRAVVGDAPAPAPPSVDVLPELYREPHPQSLALYVAGFNDGRAAVVGERPEPKEKDHG